MSVSVATTVVAHRLLPKRDVEYAGQPVPVHPRVPLLVNTSVAPVKDIVPPWVIVQLPLLQTLEKVDDAEETVIDMVDGFVTHAPTSPVAAVGLLGAAQDSPVTLYVPAIELDEEPQRRSTTERAKQKTKLWARFIPKF